MTDHAELDHADADIISRAWEALPRQDRNRTVRYWTQQQELAAEDAQARELALRRRVAQAELTSERLRHRRAWRIAEAITAPSRSVSDLARLPGRVGRVARDRTPLPESAELEQIASEAASFDRTNRSKRLAEARRALGAREYGRCEDLTGDLLATTPDLWDALVLRSELRERQGDFSAALDLIDVARNLWDDPSLERREGRLIDRMRESDVRFLPMVPGAAAGFEPVPGRVLHLLKESLPYFERGYTVRSHRNLLAAVDAGYDPVVVTPPGFPRSAGASTWDRVEVIDGVRHHRLDLGPGYELDEVPLTEQLENWAWLLDDIVAEERPSIVHAGSGHRGYETALVGLAVARRHGLGFVYEVRSSLEQTWTPDIAISESGEFYARRMAQEDRCMHEADVVLVISEALRADVIARGIDADKILVLPNGVDVDAFARTPTGRDEVRAELGVGDDPLIGYISNLGQREGFEVLIDAVHELRRRGRPVRGLVVGEGPERDRIAAQITTLGLDTAVALVGHVPHSRVRDYYAALDAFVVPRLPEKASRLITPLKPYEAMAARVPVVTTDLPALREIVDPPERGFVYDGVNPEALADVITGLLDDSAETARRVERAYNWIESSRRWAHNAAVLAEAYERCVGASA